jgi:hypothetical protein
MFMERIRVDFNRRGQDGVLLSSTSRASGPISVGDLVTVYQPGEDDMEATATVVSMSGDGKVVLSVLESAIEFGYLPTDAPLWRPSTTTLTYGSAKGAGSPNRVAVPA